MRLDNEIRLDFKDVLIRPKRSTITSRSMVSLEKTYRYKNSKQTWTGIPIIAANMDTTGTFGVAEVMADSKLMTAVGYSLLLYVYIYICLYIIYSCIYCFFIYII
eukprot:GHVR01116255.1.p1 GENE.GHVR01116255.1~~GHVR01116255.1.p1  ORF type:complete len:105 (+),score=11.74 GHVR01116255.1:78-392(+)